MGHRTAIAPGWRGSSAAGPVAVLTTDPAPAGSFLVLGRRPPCRAGARQESEQLADGGLPAGGLRKGQLRPDLVAVAAAVLDLDDVAGPDQVGDDRVSTALGDAQDSRDIPQARSRVLGDTQQYPGVIGQERPVPHGQYLPQFQE